MPSYHVAILPPATSAPMLSSRDRRGALCAARRSRAT
eukprot:CAMPEP_0174730056 /NCGR_PEP_ID=MMETSP1094-20130205/54842_1 /TAXON_ID=156173 /ORGANISM="Chrysochromulina brevifilum, Strain UTEX LB 985" /LENGTH=36 /DNA_ID= /DNA_START= /DNA_END= /DNA_ORIENTATION=